MLGAIAGRALDIVWRRSKKRKTLTILAGIVATVLIGWGVSPELAQQIGELVAEILAE